MHSHCSNCGRCVRACPTGAIRESRGKVLLSHKRCIRCYTCHEMCTSNAISLKRSLGGRAVALAVERKNLPKGR
jgi:Fe-S-cluster-containing hydrogenase component 2